MPQEHNYEKIIEGFLDGDRKATKTMMSFIDAAFYAWRQRLRHHEDAIISDVVFELLKDCREDKIQDKSKLRGYIGTMMKNICLKYIRLGDRFTSEEIESLNLPDLAFSPEDNLDKKQKGILFARILDRISEKCLELWILHIDQKLKYSEIAEKYDKPVNTIKSWFRNCLLEAIEIKENIIKTANLY